MRYVAAALLACLIAGTGEAGPSSSRSLINALQTRRLSVQFEKVTLDKFVKYVRTATGINIIVKKHAIEKDGGDPDGIEISLKVQNVKVLNVLKLALEPYDLGLAAKGNILIITSKRDARGKPVMVMYNVADLLMPLRDFPAPDLNLYPSSYEPPEPPEPEISQAVESSEELAELVRQFTGRDTWEDEGVNIHVFRKHLFIRQYPGVHREIRRFLAAVRGLR
ncbi:MAG: hypothetical protein ACYSX0_12665 [Planctomycetota bacterium]|jgi:hypothetical protein